MTAAETAASRIRAGMAPALAIWKTSGEYGLTTLQLAAELRARQARRQRPVRRAVTAWWDR